MQGSRETNSLQILGFTLNPCVRDRWQSACVSRCDFVLNVHVWSRDLKYGRKVTSCAMVAPQTLFRDQSRPSNFKAEAHSNRMLKEVTTTNRFRVWTWTSHIIQIDSRKIAASVRMLKTPMVSYRLSFIKLIESSPGRSIKYTWLTQRPGVKSQGRGTLHCTARTTIEASAQAVVVAFRIRQAFKTFIDGDIAIMSIVRESFAKVTAVISRIWLA